MESPTASDHTHPLYQLMQRVGISSFRSLSEKAGVSRWQVQQLRQGKIHQMRLAVLAQLAATLEISLNDLLVTFGIGTKRETGAGDEETAQLVETLRQEYARLQSRMEQQAEVLRSQFQTESLQVLESWLRYWPTAARAAIENPQFPARNLPPLVKPVEKLVTQWGVVAFESIGASVPYDPQRHNLDQGDAKPGDLVCVRHLGYEYQGKLLQRATVRPIAAPEA